MSSDFSDMPDYKDYGKSICFKKGCSDSTIASCCGCPDYFEEQKKKKESECNKNSNCPRHNVFEGMSDEEIKNLFNDKKEEKKKEKSIEEEWKKVLKEHSDLLMHPIHIGNESDENGEPTGINKLLENNTFTPDELMEILSEHDVDYSDYIKSLKIRYPGLFNLKPFKTVTSTSPLPGGNDCTPNLPDDIVPLPHEDSLGYNPTEYPELNKALKDAKNFKKSDIPSGVNYGKCGGIKNDMNKPQLSLVPMQMVRDAALARMYGNNKYKDVPGYSSNNWCTIDKQRVIDALLRHILLYLEDMDGVDSESGLPHLCHVAANLAFLCEMQQPNWEEKKNKIIDNDPILSKSKPKE